MRIPFVDLRPVLAETEADWRGRFERLIARAHFILGEEVASFEQEFASACGARHAVGVGTGTAALELCLRAAGVAGSGREVITSPLTAPFTGLAIFAAGLKPRFADVDPETLLLDPDSAGEAATRRTVAVMPVHLYGQPCDLPRFSSLARSLRVALIQDACQAHGACWEGRPLTAFSPFVAYSFYPTKNLGCLGDGGAVVTDRTAVARAIRTLRDGGRGPNHVSRVAGINSRLDEMQACFLHAFLPKLAEWNERRARIAAVYEEALADCPGVRIVRRRPGSVYHLFVIRVRKRRQVREHLARNGIGTAIHYPVPLHRHPAFRDCGVAREGLRNAEQACREILSLPLWPAMPPDFAHEVAGRIRESCHAKPTRLLKKGSDQSARPT